MFRSYTAAANAALPLIIGGVLLAVTFGAKGGTELTRTTITEVALVLVSGVVVAAAFLWGRRGAIQGVTTVLMFALLAFLTALSVLWSIAPELSYIEAGRTFAYLALFTASVALARLVPSAAPGILGGLAIAVAVTIAYALVSRVWPGAMAEHELSNRLGQPFDYWNAVGCVAAMGVPVLLWLGARRTGSPLARVVAYPAMGMCILAIALTQSRGAAAAAAVGVAAWFLIVPLRLRSLPVLLVPLAAAGAVSAWALSKDAFTKTLQPLSAKEAVAGEFGALVLLMLLVLVLAGAAVNVGAARRAPSPRLRRRVGAVAVAVALLVPLAAFTSVAFSERGIGDRIDALTSETQVAPEESGARVFAPASSRGKYWREALKVFDDRPVEGAGAGAFATARLRHRTDASVTRHAHGWFAQTMADLGLVGLVVTTLLLLAWTMAALSATGLLPRRLVRETKEDVVPRRDWTEDRIALVTLALVPVVFAVQSLLDWTWFIPAPAAMMLVSGGFVVGRGPFGREEPAPMLSLSPPPKRTRIAGAVVTVLAALLLAWAIWQPEASDRATSDALALADERKFDEALERTEDAEDINPLTPDPLLVRAGVDTQANRIGAAEQSLVRAVRRFPGDPQTWYRLAAFELGTRDNPQRALQTIRGALYLDPHSPLARQLFLNARARLREQAGTAQPQLSD